jgi:hypothetical protein
LVDKNYQNVILLHELQSSAHQETLETGVQNINKKQMSIEPSALFHPITLQIDSPKKEKKQSHYPITSQFDLLKERNSPIRINGKQIAMIKSTCY